MSSADLNTNNLKKKELKRKREDVLILVEDLREYLKQMKSSVLLRWLIKYNKYAEYHSVGLISDSYTELIAKCNQHHQLNLLLNGDLGVGITDYTPCCSFWLASATYSNICFCDTVWKWHFYECSVLDFPTFNIESVVPCGKFIQIFNDN